jgi:EVE domain-containing protein
MRRHTGRRFWVGVASRDHVQKGVAGGFAQLGHGKRAPLVRMAPGDWIVYYSPRTRFPDGEPYQRFTAIGQVTPGEAYPFPMSDDFVPYRRAVRFPRADEAPIQPLLQDLAFVRDKRRWGYIFRRGHFEISERDFRLIATAMGVGSRIGDAKAQAAANALPEPA